MDSATWLETDRLALRRFVPEDLPWLLDLYSFEDVVRYLGGRRAQAEIADIFQTRFLDYYEANPGLGIWMTIEKASQRAIGFHLLNRLRGEQDIQVGYALFPDQWGKGYATEMARAVVHYGFRDLGLPRIVAITNIPNTASQHVLEKIGLGRGPDRRLTDPFYASQGPMAWFECSVEEWSRRTRPLRPTTPKESARAAGATPGCG